MSSDDGADRDGEETATTGAPAAESLTPEELTWRDYLAIVVALAQTVLLPFLLVALFLLLFYAAAVYLF